ncbi:MAG: hypothetical protein V3V02_08855 [Rhizobiaceae bacterium]
MKFFDRMIAAREAKARRYVASTMLNFDETTLKDAGYTCADMKSRSSIVYPF